MKFFEFNTAREAFTWIAANAQGVVTVRNGGRIECSPAQAQEALNRMGDPWPARFVQPLA